MQRTVVWSRRLAVWLGCMVFMARSTAEVAITEFMAVNNTTLADQDLQYSDWIELHNSGSDPVDLAGWCLTDDAGSPAKWRFPATTLAPDGYLVVFASGKDRAGSGGELHTNFKLDGAGEYLALVEPDGVTVASVFSPQYPPQRADVSYGLDPQTGAPLFLIHPTPGWQNDTTGAAVAEEPGFSLAGGVYTNASLSLTLSVRSPTAVIRYTLDLTDPTEASPVYAGPLAISGSTLVRARAFDPGLEPGPIVTRTYTLLGSDVAGFSSNLPLILINAYGRTITESVKTRVNARFIETRGGRAALTGAADHDGWAGIEIRGSSSLQFPKHSYSIETQDETGDDEKVSLLGFPRESDWVLYAPYTDKTLMRDVLGYELHGQMGHYSVRTRFVEVFVNAGRGRVTMSQYAGVYVFEEKIKRGKDRVDVARLEATDNSEPEVTGGYIIKKDRLDPGDSGFSTGHAGVLAYVDPKEQDITPEQAAWLSGWFRSFESALYGAGYRDPVSGYAAFIDVNSFIDQHWIVEFTKNIDGFRLSNYMHKDRLGKLAMDPIWDWNLSFGNANYLNGWLSSGWYWPQLGATDYPWFGRLFQDPDFAQRYIDRWGELRREVLATPRLLARVDELAAFLNEAQVRNYQKWRILGTYVWPNWYIGRSYQDEINWMKQWIAARLNWIDGIYTPAPVLSLGPGPILPGTSLTLTAPRGLIYYTLNGEDPRVPGGGIRPQALTYAGPLTLSSNSRVFARARYGVSWSPPSVATFVTAAIPLAVSEIMYHPPAPPSGGPYTAADFQFIELKNVGSAPLALDGVHFTNGIQFVFGSGAPGPLAPGQHVLVVKNIDAFNSRYGAVTNVAGEFLGNLANEGERVTVEGALGEPIADFRYDDAWWPATDGLGFSLVPVDEKAPPADWSRKSNWRASAAAGGSPGAEDPPPAGSPVLVNEALTHTDPPQLDSVEIRNPNAVAVDIGNWFLTDQRSVPKKFRIPAPRVIPAGGFVVLTENEWNANPSGAGSFRLDSHGEEIHLFAADPAGNLTGYSDGFSFGAARNGVSFARYLTSTGEAQYPASSVNTLGGPNAAPRVGPVVINEIRYRPALGDEEFVELKNITAGPVELDDPDHPANTWRLNGAGFSFPPGVILPPNGLLVLAGADPAVFRLKYNVPAAVPVFALFPGVLQGGGERLALQRPDPPDLDTNSGAVFVPYVDVDVVRYDDKAPWPTNADGGGPSLERLDPVAYGNDPVNWRAAFGPGTPGRDAWEEPGTWKARFFTAAELADAAVSGDAADPDGDGQGNFQEYLAGTDPRDPRSCLKMESAGVVAGTPARVEVRFDGVADRTYTVQCRDSLTSGTWLKLTNAPPPLASGPVAVTVPAATNSGTRYYRVVTPWQP